VDLQEIRAVADANLRKSVHARQASFADYDRIAVLETRNGLSAKSPEEWKHLWLDNPAYRAVGGQLPIGWVLEDQDGEIVGSFGNIPLLFEFRGHPLIAASGRSWVVDPKYRGYAILPLNYFLNQKGVGLYLNATANAQASEAFSVFQASRVPVGKWDESIFWITAYRGFVQSSLSKKSARIPEIVSYPTSAALFLLDTLIGKNRRQIAAPLNVSICDTFDTRFDTFWEQLRSSTPRLLTVRSCEVLNWHFKYALQRKELLILTAGGNSSIEAYAIFGRQDNVTIGLKRMRLVDFQCVCASAANVFLLMLASALQRCSEDGVHILEITGISPEQEAAVRQFRPYRRKLDGWRYLYKTNDPQLAELLKNPSVWGPTCYDGDASL
jgi:hypothetical protein